MKFFDFKFDKIKDFLNRFTEILLLVVAVSLLLGILFGPETAFVGSVYQNFAAILNTLGEEGIIALVSLCLLYTSPSPRDLSTSRMPSSA